MRHYGINLMGEVDMKKEEPVTEEWVPDTLGPWIVLVIVFWVAIIILVLGLGLLMGVR